MLYDYTFLGKRLRENEINAKLSGKIAVRRFGAKGSTERWNRVERWTAKTNVSKIRKLAGE
jgi:hypothetical protein